MTVYDFQTAQLGGGKLRVLVTAPSDVLVTVLAAPPIALVDILGKVVQPVEVAGPEPAEKEKGRSVSSPETVMREWNVPQEKTMDVLVVEHRNDRRIDSSCPDKDSKLVKALPGRRFSAIVLLDGGAEVGEEERRSRPHGEVSDETGLAASAPTVERERDAVAKVESVVHMLKEF